MGKEKTSHNILVATQNTFKKKFFWQIIISLKKIEMQIFQKKNLLSLIKKYLKEFFHEYFFYYAAALIQVS